MAYNPLIPQHKNNHYVVVTEHRGGSSSNTTKTTAQQNLPSATKLNVPAARSGRGNLPHYANASNASVFGNRLHMQEGTYKGHVGPSQVAYERPTGNMFSGGLGSADATMAAVMQGLNAGIGLVGQGLSAFKAPAGTKTETPGSTTRKVTDNRSVISDSPKMSSPTAAGDAAVTKMQNAKTPAELRAAIGDAQSSLSNIPAEKSRIEGEMKKVFESEEKFTAAKKEVDDAKSLISSTKSDITKTKESIAGYEKNVKVATEAYETASKKVSNAEKDLGKAEKALSSANPDDPNYSQLQQNVIDARLAYSKALQEQKDALTEKENSGLQLTQGEQELKQLLNTLALQEKQLAKQEKIVKENEASVKKYTDFQSQLESLTKQENELPGKIEQFTTQIRNTGKAASNAELLEALLG